MEHLSKTCDAADWFDQDIIRIIRDELREPLRFHRKQWEFAMIFLVLEKYGMLSDDKTGISFGGGNERLLYSISKHVKKLFVTDLYDERTTWDTAKTSNPDEFIKISRPFDVDFNKIKALRMDMRKLDFQDNTFEFCYSSCSFEHIGTFDDFVCHLKEVHRCLKENGIYVFTTEFHYGNETIKIPNNYIFSPEYLNNIIAASDLTIEVDPVVSISPHEINSPLPSNIKSLCYHGDVEIINDFMSKIPHINLLSGNHPFTSILLILKKKKVKVNHEIRFEGFRESLNFINSKINDYKHLLKNSELTFYPFSVLPGNVSRYFLDHSDFFNKDKVINENRDVIFHTDYFWLADGIRTFSINMLAESVSNPDEVKINLRIHRYETLFPANIECIFDKEIGFNANGIVNELFQVPVEEKFLYAILAKFTQGQCRFYKIEIKSIQGDTKPLHEMLINSNQLIEIKNN